MSDSFTKPVPHPMPDTQPFWDGLAREGEGPVLPIFRPAEET